MAVGTDKENKSKYSTVLKKLTKKKSRDSK